MAFSSYRIPIRIALPSQSVPIKLYALEQNISSNDNSKSIMQLELFHPQYSKCGKRPSDSINLTKRPKFFLVERNQNSKCQPSINLPECQLNFNFSDKKILRIKFHSIDKKSKYLLSVPIIKFFAEYIRRSPESSDTLINVESLMQYVYLLRRHDVVFVRDLIAMEEGTLLEYTGRNHLAVTILYQVLSEQGINCQL